MENGEILDKPLGIITADNAISRAQYTLQNNLLDTIGWKRF